MTLRFIFRCSSSQLVGKNKSEKLICDFTHVSSECYRESGPKKDRMGGGGGRGG